MKVRILAIAILVGMIVIAAMACSQDTATPDANIETPISPTEPTDPRLTQAIGWVPLQFKSEKLGFADYEKARIASDAPDFEGFETILNSSPESIPALYAGLPRRTAVGDDSLYIYESIGLDLLGVDLGIWSDMPISERTNFMVMEGSYGGGQLASRLTDIGYKMDSYRGITYYWYWDDEEPRSINHPLRVTGQLLNVVAPMEDRVLISSSIETLTTLIDVQRGQASSLLDSRPHKVLMETLSDELLGGSFLSMDFVVEPWESDSEDSEAVDELATFTEDWSVLPPYSLALMGYGIHDSEEEIVIALYYPDSNMAEEAAQELERRWNSFEFDPTQLGANTDTRPVTRFCSPFSTRVEFDSESFVVVGSCPIIEVEGEPSTGSNLWKLLIDSHQLQFLIPDVDVLLQG